MMKRKPLNEAAAPLDPIAALEAAIVSASEQTWAHHAVSLEERDRLRPGVMALAQTVAAQLRVEHAARAHR